MWPLQWPAWRHCNRHDWRHWVSIFPLEGRQVIVSRTVCGRGAIVGLSVGVQVRIRGIWEHRGGWRWQLPGALVREHGTPVVLAIVAVVKRKAFSGAVTGLQVWLGRAACPATGLARIRMLRQLRFLMGPFWRLWSRGSPLFQVLQATLQFLACCIRRLSEHIFSAHELVRKLLTVVPLSDAILYPSTFSKIWDLCPVLVRVGIGTESTARAVGGRASGARRLMVRIVRRAMHLVQEKEGMLSNFKGAVASIKPGWFGKINRSSDRA